MSTPAVDKAWFALTWAHAALVDAIAYWDDQLETYEKAEAALEAALKPSYEDLEEKIERVAIILHQHRLCGDGAEALLLGDVKRAIA